MDREQDFFINFQNGTSLFTGVVEERNDPLMLGRVRVRVFGIHAMDRSELPTEALPWASVVLPVTEAGASGIGANVPGLIEGSWVVGFFRDGFSCQDPVIFGSLPSVAPPNWTGVSNFNNQDLQEAKDQVESSDKEPPFSLDELQNKTGLNETQAFFSDPQNGAFQNVDSIVKQGFADATFNETDKASEVIVDPFPNEPDLSESEILERFATYPNEGFSPDFVNSINNFSKGFVDPLKTVLSTQIDEFFGLEIPQDVKSGLLIYLNNDSVTNTSVDPFVPYTHPNYFSIGYKVAQIAALNRYSEVPIISLASDITNKILKESFGELVSYAFDVASIFPELLDIASSAFDILTGSISSFIPQVFFPLEQIIGSVFGSILAPLQLVEGAINSFWDALSEVKLSGLLNGHFAFETIEEIRNQIIEPISFSFGDIRRGVFPGTNASRPLTKFPLYPSESDIHRVSRGDPTVNQPGGMKWNYDKQRDPLFRNEPEMEYSPRYPYNHYKETESGHIFEFDDTPDFERVQLRHKSGSGIHINPDGSAKYLIKGDNYEVFLKDNKIHVYGSIETYIDTDSKVSINGEATINVGRNANISVQGNCNLDVEQHLNVATGGDINLSSGRDINIKAKRDLNIAAFAEIPIKTIIGEEIDGEPGEGIKMISSSKTLIGSSGLIDILSKDTVNIQGPNAIHLNSFSKQYQDLPKGRMHLTNDLHEFTTFKELEFHEKYEGALPEDGAPSLSSGIIQEAMNQGQLSLDKTVHRQNDIIAPNAIDETDNPPQSPQDSSVTFNIVSNNYRNPNNSVYDTKISDYFYLRDLTWSPVVQTGQYLISKCGLSEEDIMKNLSNLAKVALDPLADLYGGPTFSSYGRKPGRLQITSGFRRKTSCGSWHSKGCAVDIQIVGLNAGGFFDLAVQCKNVIKGFDHILLEYAPSRTNRPWIHLGVRRDAARGKCQTYYNDRIYQPGADRFVNLGYTYR